MTARDENLLRGLDDLKYLFGDKWVPAILVVLSNGPMRRKDILSTINSYSIGKEWSDKRAVLHDSYLARTVKKLTEAGLVTRTRDTEAFPPRVYYSVKAEVVESLELTKPLLAWIEAHPELIAQARAYSRQRGRDMGTLTGIDELGDGDIEDEDDDEDEDD
ncbi:helix-turn-helix transcriptional regulator [Solihabitans fulvus]|uniref:Helix-turn-helix transcriptional regulator n=1 Tax=Solihabitans fulvus TaxID=1892852 RepID=A0A5B2WMP2_9PSEU|nr:winged helix-turn-helix transcriptional regulator [Solihabitans fulvus]KAA2253303.1 helix-turn-helix transcriptional regulator [Solihabitans fulvus]